VIVHCCHPERLTARALKVREETIFWARHDRDEAGNALVLKEPVPELGPGRQRR